ACIHNATCTELAPFSHYFAHAGLSALWSPGWWSSRHERSFAHNCSAVAISRIAPNDRGGMEKCDSRSIICNSSTACRIRRLDKRAKGCAERRFLFTDAGGLRSLHTRTLCNSLPNRRCLIHSGAYVQAYARNGTFCP